MAEKPSVGLDSQYCTVIQQPGLLQRPAVPHSRSSLRPNNGALKVAWMVIPIMLGRMWRRPRKCFFSCPVLENTTPNKKGGEGRAKQSRGRDEEGKKILKGFFKIADFLEGERKERMQSQPCRWYDTDSTYQELPTCTRTCATYN